MHFTPAQTMLAKLLAKENITIQHGNFTTAFFDVEKRVLGLPIWEDRGKDVYDLLSGHEVGHALETPPEGWHDADVVIPNCPKAYLNIVEDIRIEKLVQRRYPGLVSSFKRGYSVLHKENFFGLEGKDVAYMGLADRINLKAKLRDLLLVPFYSEEKNVVDLCFAVETWDDTLEATKALYEFALSQQEKYKNDNIEMPISAMAIPNDLDEKDIPIDPSASSSDDSEVLDMESRSNDTEGESQEEQSLEKSSDQSSDKSDEEGEDGDSPSAKGKKDDDDKTQNTSDVSGKDAGRGAAENETKDVVTATTENAFRENSSKLLENHADLGHQPLFLNNVNRNQIKQMIVPIEKITESRNKDRDSTPRDPFLMLSNGEIQQYKDFLKETKAITAIMAKEFEMRKSAYQYQRAQTAKSGSIDVNKLHSYQFNEDIFSRVTTLADAKSHGLVLFIDYSGSMHGVFSSVLKQVLNIAMFCKKINVPFDVYGFTTCEDRLFESTEFNTIRTSDAHLLHVLSSSFSKGTYEKAYASLFYQTVSSYLFRGRIEWLGGTPLDECILASELIISDFKSKHNIQKVNAIYITDGYGGSIRANYNDNHGFSNKEITQKSSWSRDIILKTASGTMRIDHKTQCGRGQNGTTSLFLNHIRKMEGVTTIGFFLADSTWEAKNAISETQRAPRSENGYREFVDWKSDEFRALMRAYNKSKMFIADNKLGYDRYFILKSSSRDLDTSVEDFDVHHSARRGDITKAFKKHASSKKTNRALAVKFSEMIA